MTTRHYLYFPTPNTADAAAGDLRRIGAFKIRVKVATSAFLVLAETQEHRHPCERRQELSRIAETHGGEYDGWEAEDWRPPVIN
jgi:hypothetical protein